MSSKIIKAPEEVLASLHPEHEQSNTAKLAFYAGLAGTVAVGILEWPIAAAVGIAHALASSNSPTAKEIAEELKNIK